MRVGRAGCRKSTPIGPYSDRVRVDFHVDKLRPLFSQEGGVMFECAAQPALPPSLRAYRRPTKTPLLLVHWYRRSEFWESVWV